MASIVVIDSEETVRSVIAKILDHGGHAVKTTGEFEQAVAWLYESMPDLVLTNVVLRVIAGHDATLLKRDFPSLPIPMVSGLPNENVIHEWTGKKV